MSKKNGSVITDQTVVITKTRTVRFVKTLTESEVKRLIAEKELNDNEALRQAGVTVNDITVRLVVQGYEDDDPEFIGADVTVDKSESLNE